MDFLKQYIEGSLAAAQYDKEHGGSGHLDNPVLSTDPNKVPPGGYLIQHDKAGNTIVTRASDPYAAITNNMGSIALIVGGAVLLLVLLK